MARKKLVVLSVEDNAEIRRLIEWSLESEALVVHFAVDGAQGWQRAHELRPAVFLLDLMLPGALDGLELCRRIRADATFAGARIIVLSARAQRQDADAAQAAGADLYMSKPFSPARLVEAIVRLLAAPSPPPAPPGDAAAAPPAPAAQTAAPAPAD